jgi:hypothetical protein
MGVVVQAQVTEEEESEASRDTIRVIIQVR